VHRESNVDRQKVEMEAVRAIKDGDIKARIEFNGKWFTLDDPEWRKWFTPLRPSRTPHFADWVIDFEGEPTLLMQTTKYGRQERVKPQFNPQNIVQRYRAPTLSNICYRLDVENPDVDRFIAYSDVWNWRTECISLQDTLPIDEAGSRAEEAIRNICINTPEKLRMLGLRKTDPDAELKPVTPQAWQVLSINPLYDRATKGDGGAVIWTGLCFDRKQLVAAFVTGGGNGPQRRQRKQPARERAQRALVERFPNGIPDQASMSDAELVFAVNKWITTHRQGNEVSRQTILRAAGRLK
jgi:hypothetical protein